MPWKFIQSTLTPPVVSLAYSQDFFYHAVIDQRDRIEFASHAEITEICVPFSFLFDT